MRADIQNSSVEQRLCVVFSKDSDCHIHKVQSRKSEQDRVVAQIIRQVFAMSSEDFLVSSDYYDVALFGVAERLYDNGILIF